MQQCEMPELNASKANPADDELRGLLSKARTIAIVGAKDKPGQPVDDVGRYLISEGYNVIPVHPVRRNVWGLKTYASLADIPEPVDIVDVFRANSYCPEHAKEAAALPHTPSVFWMQLGIGSEEAQKIASGAGMSTVANRCIMVDHRRLIKNG